MTNHTTLPKALEAKFLKDLALETFETRRMDADDFSDQAIWALKKALEEAYQQGKDDAIEALRGQDEAALEDILCEGGEELAKELSGK